MLGDWWAFSLVLYFILDAHHPYTALEYDAKGDNDPDGRNYLKRFFLDNGTGDPDELNRILFRKLSQMKSRPKHRALKEITNHIAHVLMFPPAKKDLRTLLSFCIRR